MFLKSTCQYSKYSNIVNKTSWSVWLFQNIFVSHNLCRLLKFLTYLTLHHQFCNFFGWTKFELMWLGSYLTWSMQNINCLVGKVLWSVKCCTKTPRGSELVSADTFTIDQSLTAGFRTFVEIVLAASRIQSGIKRIKINTSSFQICLENIWWYYSILIDEKRFD